jgi:flavodoxin
MRIKQIVLLPVILFAGTVNASQTTQPRVLVAYFSMQDGNTGDVARAIVDVSGGDIYRIMVAEPYPADDKVRKELLTQQIEQNILPPLAGQAPQIAEYDIIFLGSPVWANHLSQPVKSFLAKYDLSGKTVIPFVSHSGGGRGKTFSDVAELCDGCIVDTDGWSSWGGGRQRGIVKWVQKKLNTHQ